MVAKQPQATLEGYEGPVYTDATRRLTELMTALPWHDGHGPNLEQYAHKMVVYLGTSSRQTSDGYHWAALYHFGVEGHEAVLAIPRANGWRHSRYVFARQSCLYFRKGTSLKAAELMVLRLMRLMSEAS